MCKFKRKTLIIARISRLLKYSILNLTWSNLIFRLSVSKDQFYFLPTFLSYELVKGPNGPNPVSQAQFIFSRSSEEKSRGRDWLHT